MNLVWIHCSEILAPEVMGILDECGLASYRVWKNVLSRDGGEGRTHWDDAVFPGKDWAIQTVCGAGQLEKLEKRLAAFSSDPYVRECGIQVLVQDVRLLVSGSGNAEEGPQPSPGGDVLPERGAQQADGVFPAWKGNPGTCP